MVAEPGPNFRWGVVLRKSKLKRTVNPLREVELVAESMDHQELEVVSHIRDNNMGVIVETYKDMPRGGAPLPNDPDISMRSWTSPRGGLTASRS
jgi:hypothetical protein